MKFKIRQTASRGRDLNWPNCHNSKMICEMFNRKTLTNRQVQIIKKFGHEIEFQDERPKI